MIMKRIFHFFLVTALLITPDLFGQDNPDGGNKPPKTPGTSKMQRKAARKKWKEERKQERMHRKAVKKKQKQLQTKKTLRRMKRDKRKAMRNNQHKQEFFLKRWFSKKQR
jgi:hypothetical protein